MVSFHVTLEAHNSQTNSPADVSQMLMKIRSELLQLKTSGDLYDVNGQYVGQWSYDISEENDNVEG